MPVYALFVTHRSGYVRVLTFPTLFDRALHMVLLSAQPVTLRMVDYAVAA
jgi:hypothetical protein